MSLLAAVPQLLDQLQIAIAKQTTLGSSGKAGKGTAHERSPVNWGIVAVRDALTVELAMWGDDIPAIRKHPDAGHAAARIGRAIRDAYRAIDRTQERHYLGRCGMYDEARPHIRCQAELWAKPKAAVVQCPKCDYQHDVVKRRLDLLEMAEDMLFTVKDAALMVGDVGKIRVTESAIRGYVHRGRLGYRAGTRIRLGDLLAVVVDEGEKRSA